MIDIDYTIEGAFHLGKACNMATVNLDKVFPGMVKNLRFEHYDPSGYWFTFELVNDDRRQTYCIRPNEL